MIYSTYQTSPIKKMFYFLLAVNYICEGLLGMRS